MRAWELNEKESADLPDIEVGDELKIGKFKNRKAEVKGFKKDKHNHPVAKTTKGDVQLLKPRVTKLEPKKIDETVYKFRRIGSDEYETKVGDHVVTISRLDPKDYGDRGPIMYKLYVDGEWCETFDKKRDAVGSIDWAIDVADTNKITEDAGTGLDTTGCSHNDADGRL